MRLPAAPAATALSVVPLQGQITMPPVRNEPLAIGAMKSWWWKYCDLAAGVRPSRAASCSSVEIVEVDGEVQLLANHVAAGGADREMHVAARCAQHFEQPHGVDRAAGAGDADEDGMVHGAGSD